jgi:hypothetical protein
VTILAARPALGPAPRDIWPNLLTIWPYLHTVELYFPILQEAQLRRIRQSGWWIKECRNRQNLRCGYRLLLNEPSRSQLRKLDYLCEKYRAVVRRFDVALDVQGGDPQAVRQLLLSRLFMKWRGWGPMPDPVGDTIY